MDAGVLSMNDHLECRFWLRFVNGTWGDYIFFEWRPSEGHGRCAEAASQHMNVSSARCRYKLHWLTHQLIGKTLWILFYALMLTAVIFNRHPSGPNCSWSRQFFILALVLCVLMHFMGFLGFLKCMDCIMFSIPIRQWSHQFTRYYFQASRPPNLIYVSDGGVRDCCAITQLLRRGCRRILLVLANNDPYDELAVLRTAMGEVTDHCIASFFDPAGTGKSMDILFEEFQTNLDAPYLHLAIRYGWCQAPDEVVDEKALRGDLFIVKMRLPPRLAERPVQPLVTEGEVLGQADAGWEDEDDDEAAWEDLAETDLGGPWCCDWCHLHGQNCGRKWPHLLFTGNLWLTPRLASSLSRLGRELAKPAVAAVTAPARAAPVALW